MRVFSTHFRTKIAVVFLGFLLVGCSGLKKREAPLLQMSALDMAPEIITTTPTGIKLGGFSGLVILSRSDSAVDMMTHTDRGPNGWTSEAFRPFLIPEFVPRWVYVRWENGKVSVLGETLLKDSKGNFLSGLPTRPGRVEETATDKYSKQIPADLFRGVDLECIARDEEGNYWMGDEYFPSILKFNAQGMLLKKWIPRGALLSNERKSLNKYYGSKGFLESMPRAYGQRESNRGFEAMSIYDGKLYVMLQSALKLPSTQNKKVVRILVMDLKSETFEGEYFYLLENEKHKIGDLTVSKEGKFFVIEQDGKTGPKGFKKIYQFVMESSQIHKFYKTGAEEIQSPELFIESDFSKHFSAVTKKEKFDLSQTEFAFTEKLEGLAWLDDQHFAIVNDNDFGLENNQINEKRKSYFGIIEVKP